MVSRNIWCDWPLERSHEVNRATHSIKRLNHVGLMASDIGVDNRFPESEEEAGGHDARDRIVKVVRKILERWPCVEPL